MVVDSDDYEKDVIEMHIKYRWVLDEQRIQPDKKRFESEKLKEENEDKRALCQEGNDASNLCIDKRRVNL